MVGEEEGRWRAEGGERGEGGEEKRGEVSERERESLEGKDFLKVRVGGVESPSGGSFYAEKYPKDRVMEVFFCGKEMT